MASFQADHHEIDDSTSFRSLPYWDSLAHVEFVARLEAAFAMRLDADQVEALDTLSFAAGLVAGAGQQPGETSI